MTAGDTAHFDVVVIGGGMVGAAVAAALGDTPLQVAVVEAQEPPEQPSSDGRRVSALTAGSLRFLEGLGVGPELEAAGAPIREMSIRDGDRAGTIGFAAEEIGLEQLGAIVPNAVIASALQRRLGEHGNIHWLCPASWTGLRRTAEGVRLDLALPDEERAITANLVVAADGRDSAVRAHAGLGTVGWDYGQSAVVAEVAPERPHRGRAFQRFLRGGPVALLPLPEGRASLVWSVPTARAEGLVDLPDDAFADRLYRAFGPDLGRLRPAGPRGAFPLRLEHARRYVDRRLALVGDAAHAVHPLAGLGLNLGLRDAGELARTVVEAHVAGEDPGSEAVLARYQRHRRPDNWLVSAYTDGFHRLFANDLPLLGPLRSLGLGVTDRAGPLKRVMMRQGMGLLGREPFPFPG